MKTLTLTISLLLFVAANSFSQVEVTTPEGRKVMLNNDGTWSFMETSIPVKERIVNCSQFISESTDEENNLIIESKNTLSIKGEEDKGINITVRYTQSGKRLSMHFEVLGSGDCLDGNSMMNIKMRTGNLIHLENDADYNCERKFELLLGKVYSNKEIASILSTTEVESVGIWTIDGYVEVTLTPQESKSLSNVFYCMVNRN